LEGDLARSDRLPPGLPCEVRAVRVRFRRPSDRRRATRNGVAQSKVATPRPHSDRPPVTFRRDEEPAENYYNLTNIN
jgi:hypothetical protein